MGYELQGVISSTKTLSLATEELRAAHVVELGQGLALVPVTEALFDEVADGSQDAALGFWFLPGGFDGLLARWSAAGPVAYVEAEYFGGVGRQRAAVWSSGVVSLGPLTLDEHEPVPAQGTPISVALRSLGVRCTAGADEFTAAGLWRHRDTEDWAATCGTAAQSHQNSQ